MRVGGLSIVGLIAGAGAAETGGPMAKVISLLDSMTAEINSEMEAQAAISKKFQCWATTNRNEKEAAIATNEALVGTKEEEVKKLTAQNAANEAKIKGLEKSIAEDEQSLADSEAQRKKDADAFAKFEVDTRTAIQQLGGALTVLKKFASLAQMPVEQRRKLETLLRTAG